MLKPSSLCLCIDVRIDGGCALILEEFEGFLAQGVNAIEADVSFAPNGTVTDFYHGPGCDSGRECERRTDAGVYFNHVKRTVSAENGRHRDKMLLFYVDIKLINLPGKKDMYAGGVYLAQKLMRHLWSGAYAKRKFSGVRCVRYPRLKTTPTFFSMWPVHRRLPHASNALGDTARRNQNSSVRSYVEKAYVWTADHTFTIRRFLRRGANEKPPPPDAAPVICPNGDDVAGPLLGPYIAYSSTTITANNIGHFNETKGSNDCTINAEGAP
ncbi:hypothetical protein MTO96_037703 [Rhipicephalus appendiculatus]